MERIPFRKRTQRLGVIGVKKNLAVLTGRRIAYFELAQALSAFSSGVGLSL